MDAIPAKSSITSLALQSQGPGWSAYLVLRPLDFSMLQAVDNCDGGFDVDDNQNSEQENINSIPVKYKRWCQSIQFQHSSMKSGQQQSGQLLVSELQFFIRSTLWSPTHSFLYNCYYFHHQPPHYFPHFLFEQFISFINRSSLISFFFFFIFSSFSNSQLCRLIQKKFFFSFLLES